ncbi:MAG: hypothetical protein QHH07_08985 [Sedimentisphaerales bacterium]|nr:hypothetical protein [Sedimentisphaerales bacterium]
MPDHLDRQVFLLQINEVGSYLVFTSQSITIGPVGSPARPDLAVMADPSVPVLRLCRCQDDYLYYGPGRQGPVLLSSGQKVPFTRRTFFWFGLPNKASRTAVLTPVGLKLPRCDVQGILLAEREILIGPTKGHHIRTSLADNGIVLLLREGVISVVEGPWGSGLGPLIERARPVEMDRPVQVPPLVMVVSIWKPEV